MRSGGGTQVGELGFADAFDALLDAMLLVDGEGLIAAANRRAEDLLGYDHGVLVGQPVEVLVPHLRRDAHAGHRARYMAAPTARAMGEGLDLVARCFDGHTIPVDVGLSPLTTDQGQVVLVSLRDLTAQRIVEESLAAHAFIVQSSDDAIYQVDLDQRIISWNPAAGRMTGYRDEDVLGQSPDVLFPEHRRARALEVLTRALSGERVERHETELERRYGLLIPVELTAAPLRNRIGHLVGASVIAHDISEQRLAQDYLAESETRLREAQELANVGMWSWDSRSDVVQYSEPLYTILRTDPSTFTGTLGEVLERVAEADRDRVETAFRTAAAGGDPLDLECAIVRGDGEPGWLSVRAEVARDSSGTVVGLRGIVQDLTDRHRAEVATQEALAREREATEQLREADRLKDEFLSTVSHELRTPLTTIVGLASVLVSRPVLDDTAPDLIARIRRNGDEMHQMIERLLDFSRLEAGRVALRCTEVVLRDLVAATLTSVDTTLAEHDQRIDIAPDLVAYADPDALARVIGNLVTNAAKFSPIGTVITVAARSEPNEVIVDVRDHGSGIAPEQAEHVFERFFQVRDDQPVGKRGAGVGLSIVQRYVGLHGGRVWLESTLGEGSTFSFSLPHPEGVGS